MPSLMRDDRSEVGLLMSEVRSVQRGTQLGATLGGAAVVVAGAVGGILGADLVPSAHAFEALVAVGVMSVLALVKVVNIVSEDFSFDDEDFDHNVTAACPSRRRPFSPSVKEFVVIDGEVRSRPDSRRRIIVDEDANLRETSSLENVSSDASVGELSEEDAESICRYEECNDDPGEQSSFENVPQLPKTSAVSDGEAIHDIHETGDDSHPSLTDTIDSDVEGSLRARLDQEKRRLSQSEIPCRVNATARFLQFHDKAGNVIRYGVRNSKKRGCAVLELFLKGRRRKRIKILQYDANSCVVWNGSLRLSVPPEDFSQVVKGLNLLCKVASVPLEVNRVLSPTKLKRQGYARSENSLFPRGRDSSCFRKSSSKMIDSPNVVIVNRRSKSTLSSSLNSSSEFSCDSSNE